MKAYLTAVAADEAAAEVVKDKLAADMTDLLK